MLNSSSYDKYTGS